MPKPKKVAVGELINVVNTKRKPRADVTYFAGIVQVNGLRVPVMLTEEDLAKVVHRASCNKEDQPVHSWLKELGDLVE